MKVAQNSLGKTVNTHVWYIVTADKYNLNKRLSSEILRKSNLKVELKET